MIKTAISIGFAAVLAALVSAIPAPGVHAGAPEGVPQAAGKTEADARTSGCSQRAWPYYEQGCVADFDARWRGEPRKVRLVTTDRLN